MNYDLIIKGGEVLDPAGGLRGRLDVAVTAGRVAAVAADLSGSRAHQTINAAGLLVLPGLVDLHAHVIGNGYDMGVHTDRYCSCSGVTTVCDAGSAGSSNFAALRHMVSYHVKTRVRAFVNLSAIGIQGVHRSGELAHLPYADPEGCAKTIQENADLAIGVKLRFGPGLVWEHSIEPVKMARRAADMAGNVPMMMHITDSPIPLPELIAPMRPGDIVTHCYHGRNNGILNPADGLVLRQVVEAQKAGILFDCAHGRLHFSFRTLEKALDQEFLPDTISTDLTLGSATMGPVWDLPTTMTKLLHFGMPLDEIVRRSTAVPAKIMGYEGMLGTLTPGAMADIGLFELRDVDFEMRDGDGECVTAKRRLLANTTIKAGAVWYQRPAGT